MTLKHAKDTFAKAQEVALQNDDSLGELMAVGMMELTTAVQTELRSIKQLLCDLERRVKRLD
jgi:hypothetical protein